jgi:hypothetical protein
MVLGGGISVEWIVVCVAYSRLSVNPSPPDVHNDAVVGITWRRRIGIQPGYREEASAQPGRSDWSSCSAVAVRADRTLGPEQATWARAKRRHGLPIWGAAPFRKPILPRRSPSGPTIQFVVRFR